jgi:hypothetical protein
MMVSRRTRLLGVVFLLCLLAVLLVWAGTVSPNPEQHRYPGTEALLDDYDAYVGSHAQVGGTVVQTDPVVIELTYDERTRELTVHNLEQPVTTGEQIVVFGTVRDGSVIVAEAAHTRERWEAWYMYLISFVGGLWVLARLLNGWEIDRARWTIDPREDRRFRWGDDA